jgi:hypothetical protein
MEPTEGRVRLAVRSFSSAVGEHVANGLFPAKYGLFCVLKCAPSIYVFAVKERIIRHTPLCCKARDYTYLPIAARNRFSVRWTA